MDIVRIADGLFAEHWDVIEDEASRAALRSGLPSFGDGFPRVVTTPFNRPQSIPVEAARTSRDLRL